MTERGGAIIFCRILAPRNAPPPLMPQYLIILMTERGDAIIFCKILAPAMPPPSPDATILNYLNDRERGRHIFLYEFSDHPPPPQCPPPRRHNT